MSTFISLDKNQYYMNPQLFKGDCKGDTFQKAYEALSHVFPNKNRADLDKCLKEVCGWWVLLLMDVVFMCS